jgi:Tfp pilus assembly protein FimT
MQTEQPPYPDRRSVDPRLLDAEAAVRRARRHASELAADLIEGRSNAIDSTQRQALIDLSAAERELALRRKGPRGSVDETTPSQPLPEDTG